MNETIVQLDNNLSDDSQDLYVLSSPAIPSSTSTPGEASSTKVCPLDNIPKTIKDKFYINITKHDTNWSAECVLCNKIQYDSKGVTSNMNRHVKTQHTSKYEKWINQLKQLNENNQRKIPDVFVQNRETKRKSSALKSSYGNNHPRQIQLSQSIVDNLIIDLGLPLPIVERDAFIKFMNVIDPKFIMTSRRTLSRTTIPHLYDIMNNKLKKFCNQSNFISLTLDIWTDRRLRAFFSMTGMTSLFF